MKFLALRQLLSKKSPSNDVFLKLDFDLSHIIYRNLVRNFLHDDSFWAKSCPRMMFSWNSNLTSLNYKGHQIFGQQKPWADRTHFLYISSSKVAEGRCRFPSCWRKSLCVAWPEIRYAKGLPKTARTNLLCDILVDFRTKTGAGETPCAGVENICRRRCYTYSFGPQPPFFKGNNEKCP